MPLPGQQELTDANGVDTSNASVTAISAPASGLRIKIFHLFLNVKTADDIILKSGSTERRRFYLGDTSGAIIDFGTHPLVLGAAEALVLTKVTGATTPLSYAIQYTVEA